MWHYIDVIMTTMASQITSLEVVYSTVYSDAGTGEFPAQRTSNAENVSIWWRHHEKEFSQNFNHELKKFCVMGAWTHLWSSFQYQGSHLPWQAWSKVNQSWWLRIKTHLTQRFLFQMWWRIRTAALLILKEWSPQTHHTLYLCCHGICKI